jgi:hypothetical protein
MICSKGFENINKKLYDDALKQVSKFKCLCSTITKDGENREDIMQRIREAEIMFNTLSPELNPICYMLALLAHHFLHISRINSASLV